LIDSSGAWRHCDSNAGTRAFIYYGHKPGREKDFIQQTQTFHFQLVILEYSFFLLLSPANEIEWRQICSSLQWLYLLNTTTNGGRRLQRVIYRTPTGAEG
jgi:hypothetical protein